MASSAAPSLAERAVEKAAEMTGGALRSAANLAGGPMDALLGKLGEVGESQDPVELTYGIGAPPEAARTRRFDAISALAHGARRLGATTGLGYASMKFASSVLLASAAVAMMLGSVMMVEAGEELSLAKAIAGDLLYLLAFAAWITRAALRLADAARGDHERVLIKELPRRPAHSTDISSTLASLRVTAIVFELAGAIAAFLGCIAFLFVSKTQGVAPYVLWLLGTLCLLGAAFTDRVVSGEVWAASKCLPGHTQRLRAFAELAAADGTVLAATFLVVGAVLWTAHSFAAAHLMTLVGSVLLVCPCVGDIAASLQSATLQMTDFPSVTAAQVALDMHAPPTGPGTPDAPGVSGVMARMLLAQPDSARHHVQPRTLAEAAQQYVPAAVKAE